MRDAWPAVLGSIRGEKAYNLALGGYGPIQYLHLMRVRATALRPKLVVVGLYLGNDFVDTYNLVHSNKNWSMYGSSSGPEFREPVFIIPYHQPGKFLGEFRDWLSRNYVLYNVVTRSPLFDFIRSREITSRSTSGGDNHIVYRDALHNVLFDVSPNSRFLDMNDARIKTAIKIVKRALVEMQSEAERIGTRFLVVIIPTKERVYANLLRQAGFVEKNLQLADALRQEDAVRNVIAGFLEEVRIDFVDALPALEAEVVHRDVYPLIDPHPNVAGYRVIAEAIDRHLGR